MTRKSFGLLAAVMCLALLALPVSRVQAAESGAIDVTVTITQTLSVSLNYTSWDAGSSVSEGAAVDTTILAPNYFDATNDGNGAEDLTVTVASSTNWAAGTAAGDETYAMNLSKDQGTTWVTIDPSSGVPLADDLVSGGNQSFDLQLLVPTSTTYAGVQQTITVTVTASAS